VLVSNFTIGPGREPGDRATDYCLQITNLEPDDVEFLFECFATPSTTDLPSDPEARPLGPSDQGFWLRSSAAMETHSTPGPLQFSVQGNTVRGQARVRVAAGQSRRVRIWNAQRLSGYTTLRVPPRRGSGGYRLVRDLRGTIRVLLHASHETYRPGQPRQLLTGGSPGDVGYTTGDDHSSSAVALASGGADNEIEAEGWSVSSVAEFLDAVRDGTLDEDDLRGGRDVPEGQRVAAMLDLLSGLEASTDDLERINALLAENGAAIRLEPS
jgi:hypothetical protein